ncbi:DegQ family serine endoprotease [Dongia soli]|uniref:Probable periplasmic serine endoprotease DegP-like n=1 Tax=Dongia soli TaxID=600628 RepID=A0ABU5EDZ7_9PROT|nr:DegQ family serine endoprotease [Dongia soli]MDY0884280.1 DegQ family serine endoprotease [Dongia soli]
MTIARSLSAGDRTARYSRIITAPREAVMQYVLKLGFFAVAVAALLSSGAGIAQARSAPESFADLAEKSLPSVVNIATTQTISADSQMQDLDEMFREFLDRRQGAKPRPRKATSLGSGFIIDPNGYIVTNNHVIENADEIMVVMHDDTELKAKLIGRDPKTDLALLKVDVKKPLPAVKWGDSTALRIGDWVLAIGNPFGLGGSVTAGIVSAHQRDINAGPYDDFIQTDASINRGNSGGPMFNMEGEVVGINSAIFSPSGGSVGIGFAIPSNLAKSVIDQIRQFGHPRRGWLGVRIQSISEDLAEGLKLPSVKGALVAGITPSGPADKAGIKQGDVVLRFDGKDVTQMRGLPRMVAETPVNKKVDVVVWRKGQEMTLSVTLGELDENAEEAAVSENDEDSQQQEKPDQSSSKITALGLELAAIGDKQRQDFDLGEDVTGVVIVDVDPDGPAAEKDLRPGDVIVEVDQKAVETPKEVAARIKTAQDNGYRVVTLLVDRQGESQWIAVKIKKN